MPNFCLNNNTRPDMVVPLSNLKSGMRATIQAYPEDSHEVIKLLSLGILPGDEVEIIRRVPFGPISVKHCNNTFFALRRSHAKKILVKLEK